MQNTPISRRTLLKALLAGGGSVVALSFLPERWLKPVVHTGVLPAHAASSSCSVGTYGLTVLVTPTEAVQLLTFVTTPASMLGQTISWQFTALPTFSGGVAFTNDPPSRPLPEIEGTGTVISLGPYGYGFAVLEDSEGGAPYITGVPETMTARISFTTSDNNTCTQTFSGVTVNTLIV
jgi:hypothetical protein